MLPTFLIAGAAKAGSTTLHHYMGSHPQVFMSPDKEPAFFTAHWHEGPTWYARHFDRHAGEPAIGEATVEYMVHPDAAARIFGLLPQVRLIFILRDPIARAHSHYWHRVKTGHEGRDLDRVLGGDKSEYPIHYSRYFTHIQRYLALFPREQIQVVVMEDMQRDPVQTLCKLFAFVGVDERFQVDFQGARNTAKVPRNPALQRTLTRIQATPWVQRLLPDAVRPLVASVYTNLKQRNLKPLAAPPLPPHLVERLRAILEPEIAGIETVLGRALTEWRAPYQSEAKEARRG